MDASLLPDFIENALSIPLRDVLQLGSERPGELIAHRDAFYGAMQDSWVARTADDLPESGLGELHPLYGKGLISSTGTLSSRYEDNSAGTRSTKELKALLLYAHGVVLLNPLSPWFGLRDGILASEGRPDGIAFVRALVAVAEVAELVRAGTVVVIDPPAIAWREGLNLRNALADAVITAKDNAPDAASKRQDQWDEWEQAQDAITRLLLYAAAGSDDGPSALTASGTLEGDGLDRLVRAVTAALAPGAELPQEHTYLHSLMRLSLPGVDGLPLADMRRVRDDDHFATFRSDVRTALSWSQGDVESSDLAVRQLEVAEFMGARARALNAKSVGGRFWDSTAGSLVSFSAGAAIGSASGWKATLLGMFASGVVNAARKAPTPTDRALRQHYVALSQAPGAVAHTELSASETIARWRGGA